jgi:cobyrinic acid a,c-diamide synthase
MHISKNTVVERLASYLNRKISKEELIQWCEQVMQEDTFDDPVVQEIVGRIGLMDAKNFDVSYEDLTDMLSRLGYHLKVEVS